MKTPLAYFQSQLPFTYIAPELCIAGLLPDFDHRVVHNIAENVLPQVIVAAQNNITSECDL